MNNKDRAMIMYKDIQRRKRLREEGIKQADKFLTEIACKSINNSAKWRTRNAKGSRRID